ncbi:MAG TPA: hypothetical protein VJA66_04970 [Thermoanaerobaculia bacterium]
MRPTLTGLQPSARSRPDSLRWARLCAVASSLTALLFPAACSSSSAQSGERASAPLGAFTVDGPTFGTHSLQPGQCHVGQRELFLGFDFLDSPSGIVARLVVDPATGPVVRVFRSAAPFDSTVLFHRSDCRVFHFSLDETGWRINRIDQLRVSIELECGLPSGDHIAGKAEDPGCL